MESLATVLDGKTLVDYGYMPSDLPEDSRAPIWALCYDCGNAYLTSRSDIRKAAHGHLCISCRKVLAGQAAQRGIRKKYTGITCRNPNCNRRATRSSGLCADCSVKGSRARQERILPNPCPICGGKVPVGRGTGRCKSCDEKVRIGRSRLATVNYHREAVGMCHGAEMKISSGDLT